MEQDLKNEIRGLLQVLEHTAELAEESVITDAYKDGENRCISQFNRVLKRLVELDAVSEDLFEPLEGNASFSEISIACHHLAAYLSEGLGSLPDLKGMMTNILGKKLIDITDEFKDTQFGEMIRNSMPAFLTLKTLDDITESFDVSYDGLKKLNLNTDLGSINVQSADTDKVNVFIHRSAQIKSDSLAVDLLKDFQVNFHEEGKKLNINGKFSAENQLWKKTADRIDIRFEIIVPRSRYDIDLKTMHGKINVDDVNGAVECRSANGNLQFQNITGLVFAHTENGNIRLNKGKGDIRLETLRGDIEISDNIGHVDTITSGGNMRCSNVVGEISGESSGGFIRLIECKGGAKLDASGGSIEVENDGPLALKTIGGSINVTIDGQLKDDSVLEASGGDITISLLPAIAVKLDARSVGGEVASELPVMQAGSDTSESWKLQGVINGEGPLMTLRSVGGDIILKKHI